MAIFSRRRLVQTGLTASAASFVEPLLRAERASAWFASLPTEAPGGPDAGRGREKLLMDFSWKFTLGDSATADHDLNFGKDQADFSKAGGFPFAKASYDDSRWRSVSLPHDWAVELPFVHDEALKGHGYKPLGRRYPETSVGWYRKTFSVPVEDDGKNLRLAFDGVFRDALIFLNGYFIGRNSNGYVPFSFDVSDYLLYGNLNTIAVRVDATFGDGWFYAEAGIYRHVWLSKSSPVHFSEWDSYVRTESTGSEAQLTLAATVSNQSYALAHAKVRWEILDEDGTIVCTGEAPEMPVDAGREREFLASTKVHGPAVWSVYTPK